MTKKKVPGQLGSSKIKDIQAMMASDSDSYGSEGGLKAKEVVIKKRGGKKRNKNGEMESQATFNNNSADEMDDIMDDVSEATYTGDLMY